MKTYTYHVLPSAGGYKIIRVTIGTLGAEVVATTIDFEMAQTIALALESEFQSRFSS